MFTTAISVTCITRTIKENVTAGLKIKKSFLSSIASAFGILTIQACGLSAPICGASVGASVVATFFPSIMFAVLDGYGNYLLFLAIISQLVGIYLMKCFKN